MNVTVTLLTLIVGAWLAWLALLPPVPRFWLTLATPVVLAAVLLWHRPKLASGSPPSIEEPSDEGENVRH